MGNQQITPKQLASSQPALSNQPKPSTDIASNKLKPRPGKLPPLNASSLASSKLKRSATSSQLSRFKISSFSKVRIKRKNSADILQITENLDQENSFSPEELDNIYFTSEGNLDVFYNNLQQPLSKLYTEVAKHALTYMSNKLLLTKSQAKLFLCQKILKANLNIFKIIGQKTKHQFNESIFKNFNELQKSIIGYLKTKYPRGQQNFVSVELMKVFKPFDYLDSPQNDIVRQSGFYFKKQFTRSLLRKIKEFLNKVIDEVDLNFPRFQRMFQDRVFKTTQNQDKTLVYRINRRLPQTISKFTSINSNSLDIESPELFRVILKWVDDMEEYLINPQKQVQQKQTFKIINEEDESKYHVDQITTEENSSICQQLKQKLQQERASYQNELHDLVMSMYKFQHNLIKIVEQGELRERYVPRNDAQIIKFAAYNTKFMSWMLAEKLTIVMKKLIKVGRQFKNTLLMAPIDLIKFNVTDLLRASMQGTKDEILQIYLNLKRLESQEQIKIICLQNRLPTTSNDIKINFKLKNCFLICQLQLFLSQSSFSANEKLQSMQTLNNFFSQLEYSPYGVASQLAEQVGYKDSRVGYQKKINFVSKDFGIGICQLRHPGKISSIKNQLQPFICTTCSKYYGRLENLFIMKHCKQCNNFLCYRCILSKNPLLESSYMKQEIVGYLNSQVIVDSQNNRGKGQALTQYITGGVIYEKSFQKLIYIKDIQKQRKLKKMTITQFELYIESLRIQYFVYGIYDKGEISLISCKHNEQLKELYFALESDEDFYSSKRISYKQNDFILIYKHLNIVNFDSAVLQKIPHFNIFSQEVKLKKGKYHIYKINDTIMILGFQSQQAQQKVPLDGQQTVQQAFYSQSKKDFKFDGLKTYFQYQGTEENMIKNVKLQDLGVENKHLAYFNTISWTAQITELYLSKNKISNVHELLKVLPNIQRFIATQNYIQSFSPPIMLNNLSCLVLKRNLIKQVDKFQNMPNLQKLNMQQNRIQVFPILSLKKLRHLNLSQNTLIRNLEFLQVSTFPQLSYLNLQNSLFSIQYPNEVQQHRSIVIPYQKLKCFIINQLKVNRIIFKSQLLQRIHLSNCLISEVFGKFNHLEYFIADNSLLKSFNMLFGSNYENHLIKQINLQQCKVAVLPQQMQSKSLKKLDLTSNGLVSVASLSNYVLPQIQSLNISYNQLSSLPKLSFDKLVDLKFQGNYINDISNFVLSNLPMVQSLNFYVQNLFLDWGKFSFPKVIELTLPSVEFPKSYLQFEQSNLPNLKNLIVMGSKLQKFPKINFPKLQHLKIQNSSISQLNLLTQCKLHQSLKKLELYNVNPDKQDQTLPDEELSQSIIDLPNNLVKLQEINLVNSRFINTSSLLAKSFINIQKINIQYSSVQTLPRLSLPRLKQLFMHSNKLKDIQQFCDSDLPALLEADFSNNKIVSIKQMRFKALESLQLSNNQLVQLNGLQLPSLTRLNFSFNKLLQFPVIWAQKLTDISFKSNPLKSLNKIEECDLPMLKNIAFSSIQIQQQDVVFPKFQMPNIESVQLHDINFTCILNINWLSKLNNLSVDYCTKIKEFPTLNLPQLKTLSIKNSEFQSWRGLWESKIDNLQSLQISWTNVVKMGALRCSNLLELHMINNQKLISVEELLSTNKFNQLQSITFIGNNNLSIQTELNFPAIQMILMQNFSIASTHLIGYSDSLKQICLANSRFSELDLRQFKKLENVIASQCHIERLDKFCNAEWKFLKLLSLTENDIKSLPAFKKFPLLQSLYLGKNQIQNADQLFQNSNLPALNNLSLSNNKIKYIKSIKNMPSIAILQLENNLIENLSFLNNFQNVSQYINTIYLNNNKLNKIEPIKCSAEVLFLANNEIQSMEFVQKSVMPRITYLDISSNKIKTICNVRKLSKLATLLLQQNPIQNHNDFFTKYNMPISLIELQATVTASQQIISQDLLKYSEKYPNLTLNISKYQQPHFQTPEVV